MKFSKFSLFKIYLEINNHPLFNNGPLFADLWYKFRYSKSGVPKLRPVNDLREKKNN